MKKKLIILSIGLLIWIGLPLLFGDGAWAISWIPALLAMVYLDD